MRSPIQVWPVNQKLPNSFLVSEMSGFKRSGVKKIAISSAVVLVIAGVVLARLWCPSASEQANAITMEEIEREVKSYENSKKLAKQEGSWLKREWAQPNMRKNSRH